ncbi:ABC transporter permease [Proteiniclasticum sp. QWL-01]|uniref:ABC transporter permease n=1 Tax=Proteiniclasticum sp. QWL-01 TaxID=3036945 RepID=UPI002410CCC3|nr:ABC transporter permease [Proteiniclasticum sp. QWL-01]WFF74312.1 ABC transporter permease [Proteiniclasticum sp. QWL-01]
MRFIEILQSSVKALVKNKRRTILTMLGIIIGIASVITIIALGKGFQNSVVQNLTQSESSDVVINILFQPRTRDLSNSSRSFYDMADLEMARAIEGVEKAEIGELERGFTSINATTNKNELKDKSIALMLNTDAPKETILTGRTLNQADVDATSRVVLISKATGQDLFGDVESYLGRSVEIQGILHRIVGVYEGQPRTAVNLNANRFDIYMPKTTYEQYYAPKNSGNNLMLTIREGYVPKDVADQVMEALEVRGSMKSEGTYMVFDMALMMEGIGNILTMITYFISAIAGISLLIAGVGVMNMMYISVSERTKEIGIRRALGATKSSVRNQFLLEGLTITLIGGAMGLLVGILISRIASQFLPFTAVVDTFSVLLTVIISSSIGLFFSVMPANSAAQKDLIDILR